MMDVEFAVTTTGDDLIRADSYEKIGATWTQVSDSPYDWSVSVDQSYAGILEDMMDSDPSVVRAMMQPRKHGRSANYDDAGRAQTTPIRATWRGRGGELMETRQETVVIRFDDGETVEFREDDPELTIDD